MEVIHRERTVNLVAIRLTNEGKRRLKLADDGKCLSCAGKIEIKDGEKEGARGLCGACYQAARRAVKAGQTTETAMIRDGLMLECASAGRPLSNPLAKQLAEK